MRARSFRGRRDRCRCRIRNLRSGFPCQPSDGLRRTKPYQLPLWPTSRRLRAAPTNDCVCVAGMIVCPPMLPFKALSARRVGEVLMSFRTCRGALLSIALASFPSFECAAEDPVADFYKGRQVAIVVGTPPGSNLSLYSQALA